jgi:hypothetical protein
LASSKDAPKSRSFGPPHFAFLKISRSALKLLTDFFLTQQIPILPPANVGIQGDNPTCFVGNAEAVEALVCKTSLSGFESRRYLHFL